MFSGTFDNSFCFYLFDRVVVTENMMHVNYVVCDSPLITIL